MGPGVLILTNQDDVVSPISATRRNESPGLTTRRDPAWPVLSEAGIRCGPPQNRQLLPLWPVRLQSAMVPHDEPVEFSSSGVVAPER